MIRALAIPQAPTARSWNTPQCRQEERQPLGGRPLCPHKPEHNRACDSDLLIAWHRAVSPRAYTGVRQRHPAHDERRADLAAESAYAHALEAYLHGDFETAQQGFEAAIKKRVDAVSADFFAGVSLFQLGRVPAAIRHLERVIASEQELPDALIATYAPPDKVRLKFEIAIVQGIYTTLEVDSIAAALLLAEAYQGVGKRAKAISLMGELIELMPDDEAIRLSLCDLLFEAADFDGTIEVASPASPVTNLGFACQIFEAQGESWRGDWATARETLESALSDTEADDEQALRAAHENLERCYVELGLSPKRLVAFQKALSRRKPTEPKDPHVRRSATYENEP